MDWFSIMLTWYFYLFIIGIVFFPVAQRIFGSYFDHGYAFGKTIGIILLSYTVFVISSLKIVSFSRESLIFLVILFGFLSFKLAQTYLQKISRAEFFRLARIWLCEEFLFFFSLLLLTYVRGHEPSIHGLEKFMDFGFINSILRTQFFHRWICGIRLTI